MSITVTSRFIEAFQVCMDHYDVTGKELDFEKARVRENYADAEMCYLAISEEIKSAKIWKVD